MVDTLKLAVVGASQLVGKAVLELLEDSGIELGDLYCLEAGEIEASTVLFRNKNYPVTAAEAFDFSQVHVALFTDVDPTQVELPVQAGKAGCIVVTTQPAFAYAADIPLVVAGVNDEVLADYRSHNMVAAPDAGSCIALRILKPIFDLAGLSAVSLHAMQAVSSRGEAGIKELAHQTAMLLNAKPIEPKLFGKQIAFNVVPLDGELLENGYSQSEAAQMHALRKLLMDAVEVDSTIANVPVFYGDTLELGFITQRPIEPTQMLALWSQSEAVTVMEEGTATAVSEAADSSQIFISRPRQSPIGENHYRVSLVADNVRAGVASNLVGILEALLRDYL